MALERVQSHPWDSLNPDSLLFCVLVQERFYIEYDPNADGDEDRGVVRIFNTEEEAYNYGILVCDWENVKEDELTTLEIKLSELYDNTDAMEEQCAILYGTSFQIDLCGFQPEEWPKLIETLWVPHEERQ
jgi:hypothetical protein